MFKRSVPFIWGSSLPPRMSHKCKCAHTLLGINVILTNSRLAKFMQAFYIYFLKFNYFSCSGNFLEFYYDQLEMADMAQSLSQTNIDDN